MRNMSVRNWSTDNSDGRLARISLRNTRITTGTVAIVSDVQSASDVSVLGVTNGFIHEVSCSNIVLSNRDVPIA